MIEPVEIYMLLPGRAATPTQLSRRMHKHSRGSGLMHLGMKIYTHASAHTLHSAQLHKAISVARGSKETELIDIPVNQAS